MSIQSRRIIIFFFLTINLSYKVRQKDINIEELAQFEKTRQGFPQQAGGPRCSPVKCIMMMSDHASCQIIFTFFCKQNLAGFFNT